MTNSYEKTVYLYESVGDRIGRVQYIDHMGDSKTLVNAARVSFGKDNQKPFDEKDAKLTKYLLSNKHTSVLEHNILTCKFVVPLFVRGQHHRHRTWSFNEASRRYSSENIEFFSPKTFRTQHAKDRQASNEDSINPIVEPYDSHASNLVDAHNKASLALYEKLLASGVCREQARGVLSQNMFVTYYGTVDLNNLFKFLELRLSEHAQWEIRRVAEALLEIATDLWPEVMNAYRESRDSV